ncbi:MAG: tRNA pseudouridine(55) synthase TruB [Oscillospiraceae bacterium]|nr:tRNA pseudouridine(55) synthase TruB [Oscillospiraceae bacterium]
MANGVIVIDKPQGWTSMDVCAKLRGMYREKRVGHAGTLDPMATGVLPVFIGRATRAVEFASEGEKEYRAVLELGTVTDTQDATGTVLERRDVKVGRAELEAVLPRFRGEISQIPPMYSAVKVNGQKLYDLARKGREVERRPRPVTIHTLELGDRLDENRYELRVVCSKGTYIRTLCHDIGQALGCGGVMTALRRTCAAGYTLAQAVKLEQVEAAEDRAALLAPVDSCFAHLPALTLTPAQSKCVRNGAAFSYPGEGEWRVYDPEGAFLAVCRAQEGKMTTVKSFFEV